MVSYGTVIHVAHLRHDVYLYNNYILSPACNNVMPALLNCVATPLATISSCAHVGSTINASCIIRTESILYMALH